MKARTRSLSGAVLVLVIVPVFVGLLACMPVPVGDPERSRIDPALSGVWAMSENGSDSGYFLFRPYDKRTWLVVGVEGGEDESVQIYKAWVTKLGGAQFLTWEQSGGFNKDGSFQSKFWYVFRVEKAADRQLKLHMLDYEFSGFQDFPGPDSYEGNYARDLRRKYERVIKKNLDEAAMYGDTLLMHKLADDQLEQASKEFQNAIEFE
jgi:hypothetical protein